MEIPARKLAIVSHKVNYGVPRRLLPLLLKRYRMESKLRPAITEAGSYSYCAFIALTLQKLFPGDADENFRLKTIKDLCRHLDSEVRHLVN